MDSLRFIADVHLAGLAKYLRLLGFDTLYFQSITDKKIKELLEREPRILLTKDRELCESVQSCYLVHAKESKEQLKEVISSFQLKECHPFSRCLVDNTPLKKINKKLIEDRLPPKVRRYFDEFWICPTCHRIYWHGSHYERMQKLIDEVCG